LAITEPVAPMAVLVPPTAVAHGSVAGNWAWWTSYSGVPVELYVSSPPSPEEKSKPIPSTAPCSSTGSHAAMSAGGSAGSARPKEPLTTSARCWSTTAVAPSSTSCRNSPELLVSWQSVATLTIFASGAAMCADSTSIGSSGSGCGSYCEHEAATPGRITSLNCPGANSASPLLLKNSFASASISGW
jgi:hypothetical protein